MNFFFNFFSIFSRNDDFVKRKRTRKATSTASFNANNSRKTRNDDGHATSTLTLKSFNNHTAVNNSSSAVSHYNSDLMASATIASPYVSLPLYLNNVATNHTTTTTQQQQANNNLFIPNTSVPTNTSTNTTTNSTNSTSGRSRVMKWTAAAKASSSFFQNFYPGKYWGRFNQGSSTLVHNLAAMTRSGHSSSSTSSTSSSHSQEIMMTGTTRSPQNSGNKEKIKAWVKEQAKTFEEKHFSSREGDESINDSSPLSDHHPALSVLNRLTGAIEMLDEENSKALQEIKSVLIDGDISSFELIHSGFVKKLLSFLTSNDEKGMNNRDDRLRCFLHVFLGTPLNEHNFNFISNPIIDSFALTALVNKLNNCVTQLEQFPVRVHDVIGASSSIRGASALKFFNTHQLKCNLQRHHDCTNLRQWRGGPVKIDPLALVQAIEKYLVIRGFGRIREDDDDASDDDISDEEFDDNMAAMMISQGQSRHRIQFLIGDQVLPYNMTVYQAIRQYAYHNNNQIGDNHETDGESEPMGHANIWVATHTIYYRAYAEGTGNSSANLTSASTSTAQQSSNSRNTSHSSSSRRNYKSIASKASSKKKDELWLEGKSPSLISPLFSYLSMNLPSSVTVQDSSLEVLALLRVIYGLSRHWGWLYRLPQAYESAISKEQFINNKLTAKANRQLQDPLVIMTNNLPNWLSQISYACPFLFPFETRHLLFYVTCFDRDRALQRLLDTTPEIGGNDAAERVTPRLERRKRTVSRDDVLKQAETVLNDLGSSKALLEIQYENEVGTGLGPTLEFYALVSKELQRADLEMWRGETVPSPGIFPQSNNKITAATSTSSNESQQTNNQQNNINNSNHPSVQYIYSPNGLFPAPISRNTKMSSISKCRQKFKLLGKFIAKALMDSRMVIQNLFNAKFINLIIFRLIFH